MTQSVLLQMEVCVYVCVLFHYRKRLNFSSKTDFPSVAILVDVHVNGIAKVDEGHGLGFCVEMCVFKTML